MYRACIFCSAALGANEAIEAFPVGKCLAFDAARGRLWAVCPRCARWNLAPIEERWEATEAAEERFRGARLRAQSENVGLAKLPDGTRLIRIGQAMPGELAAWRYGGQLVRRRRQYLIVGAAAAAGTAVALGGLTALGIGAGLFPFWSAVVGAWEEHKRKKVIHRVPAADSPTGQEIAVRRWHVQGAWLDDAGGDGIVLHVPDVGREKPEPDWRGRPRFSESGVVALPDVQARAVLGRAMVHVNSSGAAASEIQHAVRLLAESASAEEFLRSAAGKQYVLGKRRDMEDRQLAPTPALALEMALHEETERRALQGELAVLEAAWRDAEEVAAIADALPDDPLARLKGA
ncbi:MAG: hypothetical protein ABW277_20025 [Longimicrobiaceae bacterium]